MIVTDFSEVCHLEHRTHLILNRLCSIFLGTQILRVVNIIQNDDLEPFRVCPENVLARCALLESKYYKRFTQFLVLAVPWGLRQPI